MPTLEILNLAPAKSVDLFRDKGYDVGKNWREVDARAHLGAVKVAKAMCIEILDDVCHEVDRAITEGTTLQEFADDLESRLTALGWWGRKHVVDALTGKRRVIRIGSPYRVRAIIDTHVRMAYAEGRWKCIERIAARRPWLRYVVVRNSYCRPKHMNWHDTVLAWNHPFWQTHYPPNGRRCGCRVDPLSDADLENLGLTPSEGPPSGSERFQTWTSRRNGETIQLPAGIDPGFGDNVGVVGLVRHADDQLIAKMDTVSADLARSAVGTPWQTPLFYRHLKGEREGHWPIATTPPDTRSAIRSKSRTVRLSSATAAKQANRHCDLRSEDYAIVQRILDEGELFAGQDGHVVGFIAIAGQLWRAVVKGTVDGRETYLVTFHKAKLRDLESARRRLERVSRMRN